MKQFSAIIPMKQEKVLPANRGEVTLLAPTGLTVEFTTPKKQRFKC